MSTLVFTSKSFGCIELLQVGVIYGTELAIQYMNKDHGGRGGLIINIGSTAGC